MTTQPVMVTGCAGFIGFHSTYKLLQKKIPVLGIDNFDPFYPRSFKEKNISDLKKAALEFQTTFEFIEADINSIDENTFKGIEISAIIHLAAKAGVRPSIEAPLAYFQSNVLGTAQILEFARQRNIKNIVFGSSSSVYGNDSPKPFKEDSVAAQPVSPYAASKRSAELLCYSYHHLYQMSFAVLRFFTVYGPRQRPDLAIRKFMDSILKDQEISLFGDGNTSRDYTFVDDIVDGIVSSLQWTSKQQKSVYEIFNLGGSKTTTLKELVKHIEDSLNKKAKVKWLSAQAGDVDHTWADISHSAEVLGYNPKTPIQAGIKKFVEWRLQEP